MTTTVKGKILTPSAIIPGTVTIENKKITGIGTASGKADKKYDFGQNLILPGFIDIHIHGLGNYSAEDKTSILEMAKLEPQYGTTAFLPTGAAMTIQQYIDLGKGAKQAREELNDNGAKILGVHLEGPFINPKSSGAMAISTRRPISLTETKTYVEQIGNLLKMMTLSPELQGSIEVIKYLVSKKVVVSLGHSIADPKQLPEFIKAGLTHICHLYDTFEMATFREPGVWKPGLAEAILANDKLTCEFICDLCHVETEYIKIAAKVLGPDRFVTITDSLQGAGLPECTYQLPDGKEYRITKEAARSLDNTLAGSTLTMNRAFANLVERCGIDPILAAKFTSLNAARVMKIDNQTGSIEVGKCADIAVLDKSYNCIAAFVNGNMVYGK